MPLKLGTNLDYDKVVKSLGQKMKLAPHLDLAIGEGDFDWHFDYSPKVSDDAWHPSGDCVPSLHELWLKASSKQEPEVIGPGLRKIFMTGHFYHQYLQWIVEKRLGFAGPEDIERRGSRAWGANREWVKIDEHTTITTGQPYHWATGSGDIAPCAIPEHGEFAVDFKTMNPRMFASGPSADYLAKWECQGNVYLDFFDLDRILFVGIDKSSGDMKEWEFHRNQPLIDAIYGKWQLVSECLDENIEPPVDEPWPLPLKGPV